MQRDSVGHELVPIGSVVALLRRDYPDVSHSSLRFLEREGLLTPTRTPGGHRLFASSDIQRLRQIKDWQAQRLSLEEIRRRLTALDEVGTSAELVEHFLECALRGDVPAARSVILDAAELGLPLDALLLDVLRPALWAVGDRWARGAVSVAQEKEVSEIAREVITELTARTTARVNDRAIGIVAACIAGEAHELGLRMVSGLLRASGLDVHYLGADVAPAFLVDAVQRRRPHAVLLSVTGDAHLPALGEAVAAIRAAASAPRLFVGGQAVARHPARVAQLGGLHVVDGIDALRAALPIADEV